MRVLRRPSGSSPARRPGLSRQAERRITNSVRRTTPVGWCADVELGEEQAGHLAAEPLYRLADRGERRAGRGESP
jgi:hypothetical protein